MLLSYNRIVEEEPPSQQVVSHLVAPTIARMLKGRVALITGVRLSSRYVLQSPIKSVQNNKLI